VQRCFPPGWSGQGGVTLSVSKAEAQARVYIRSGYAARAVYVQSAGAPGYAVRAYLADPWSGDRYSYTGWADYAGRNGIGCVPGTVVPGGDGIMYNCQLSCLSFENVGPGGGLRHLARNFGRLPPAPGGAGSAGTVQCLIADGCNFTERSAVPGKSLIRLEQRS
jgi:hypothetical protein